MVVIMNKINDNCQTARIIQWLGGERAVDVPNDFDITPLSKEDLVDHEIVSSKVECIELLRVAPINKHVTTTFKRACLLHRSLNRLSPDAQTSDEAYCTLSSHHSIQNNHTNNLIRKGSTSDSSSLSTTTPICTSSPILSISIDDIYNTLDHTKNSIKMNENPIKENFSLLNEIAQQNGHLLPMIINNQDHSIELTREIINNSEQDFKDMVEEFIQLLEKKLSDTEMTIFDTNAIRPSSPSLFDMLNDLKTCLTSLRRTEIESLLDVFDNILKLHCYPSALPENDQTIINNIESNDELLKLSQYAIDELKIVKIEKNHQPLGLTISRTDSGTIYIARIVVGGIAASTELFQINDRILEINDQPITGHSLDYICTLISNINGLIKFLLAPPINLNHISYHTFHVRALFSYDPFNDPLLPCKDIGLTFQRGNILRIVAYDENFLNRNDSYTSWWQAYHENSYEKETNICLAGLIPSDNLQQKRANLFKIISDDIDSISTSTSSSSSNNSKKKKRKTCFTCVNSKQERKSLQIAYNNITFIRDNDDKETPTIRTSTNHFSLTDTRKFGDEQPSITLRRFSDKNKDIPIDCFRFYELVFRLDLLTQQITRPIVLLGAPNVGRHELRRRLLQTEPNLFDVAIPHTTRARRLQETPDIDYHFVSEADFLAKVACHSFIEFGQYDHDLYGTSIDDIRQIVEIKRKICILNLNPETIRTFNKTNLYPYIICIAAPSLERLKRLELDRREYLTDKDYREIIRKSRSIERRHHLLFDQILINNDLDRTYLELRDLIVRIQHDNQQWIRTCYQR
ncbi:unnamed protein product [Rotaria sordida]|uniref:Uncharacterized protein n=1 Tax=Rotaria sordida TaxID=392033 RepID=A0A815ADZ9_9BILA|nr:unnamed protein product [Rotaria sordida]CAF1299350.1 unnamed protein product [Rotaria sordida]CAF3701491.1 unnamed protein product [Rotaria sordida]CAF3730971.1 unnamed protein product [Rotaria sordida]